MINIDEFSKAKEVLDLLKEKTSENEKLIDEKTRSINETFNNYFNKKDLSIDMTQKEMIESITYDKAINKIANRQLNRYFLMLDKPYFGRVDFENEWGEVAYYFGIESLLKNNEVIVNDWRSPIGNLYYEGVYGKSSYVSPKGVVEGNITLKRQYKFDKGELKHYVDTGLSISDELLIDVFGKNSDVVMKNIVSTIQKEQNEAIRYNNDNDLLVLGVAGSGKTSIALHRIAYLVYKDSIKYDSSKVCFITPNDIFYKYIDNVLPELGEENVVNLTLNEVARTILKMDLYKYKLRVENKVDFLEKVMNGKKSIDFDDWFNRLNAFLNKKMETLFVDKLGLKIGDISFRSEIFRELYFNKFSRRDYSERRRFIKEYLKDRVSTRRKVTKNIIDIIDAFVNKLLPEVNYFEVYQEFLDNIGYTEEVIFRGLLFKAIEKDSIKQAIVISAVTFGIGHIVNLLTGQDTIATILQVAYAIAIGFSFVMCFYEGGSLIPCIVTHSIINMTSKISIHNEDQIWSYIIAIFIIVVAGSYALYLKKQKN